jgi:hypothetical protein
MHVTVFGELDIYEGTTEDGGRRTALQVGAHEITSSAHVRGRNA